MVCKGKTRRIALRMKRKEVDGMKDFLLDSQKDVVINRKDIVLVEGMGLTMQKLRQVLSTNNGEWWLDKEEGIPVREIIKKNPEPGKIRDYIQKAALQVDSSLNLQSCQVQEKPERKLEIHCRFSLGDASALFVMEM